MTKLSAGLALACLVALPMAVRAQGTRPSQNMYTRSSALYLDQARKASHPEDKPKIYQKALDQALQSIDKDAGNPAGYFYAGQAYLGLGEIAKADSMLDKAEQMWPDYAKETAGPRERGWVEAYNKSVGLIQAGKTDEAIALLEQADALYQGRPTARATLASLYQNKGDVDKAIAMYRGALEIYAKGMPSTLPADAQKQWQEGEERSTSNLAQLLLYQKKYGEAAEVYKAFLAKHPDDVQAKLNLAVAYSRSENKAEASKIFAELVNQANLTDTQYFDIGAGLFQAQQLEQAAEAFRKALQVNPYYRDAAFYLAQTLLAQAQTLEDQRQKAAPADGKKVADQLNPLYDELLATTQKVLELDPANGRALRLAAATARGKGELATGPKAEEWKKKALDYLTQQQALTAEVIDLRVQPTDQGSKVTGAVLNDKLEPGTPVKIKLTLLDKSGAPLDTQEITVTAPAKDARETFSATSTAKDVAGWKYEIAK
ncbi:MAG: tetratricopeptide repeat protein [Gemmatimonadetes bacterium]|nr:tetratricopeptide repeat protein [Gemmatimonadota bacterium]